jgi:hypothetical protein
VDLRFVVGHTFKVSRPWAARPSFGSSNQAYRGRYDEAAPARSSAVRLFGDTSKLVRLKNEVHEAPSRRFRFLKLHEGTGVRSGVSILPKD